MSHYISNLRDIRFNLFELLEVGSYYGSGPFSAVDPDQALELLVELERFVQKSGWASSFAAADREPLHLSAEGDVTLPEALHDALSSYYDAGWHLMSLPSDLGGYDAPPSLQWAAAEIAAGAHATASLWPIGPLIARIIALTGTEGQRARFSLPMVANRWGGTMVLTEPDAGSDVGAGTTRAVKVSGSGPDDLGSVYHLEGVKRFITSADATPLHANTVHLVLARPEGSDAGTKGLSLFIVPKFHVEPDGMLGGRNGVRVSNLEHKMGIKGSATCELSLGQDGEPCVGYLVGDVHDGIRQMFLVIEYARMMVGTKAMSTLSTGYLNALEYAKIRIQGPDLASARDATSPRVPVIRHADVRRSLILQKSHAEGMRALVLFAGWVQDQAALAGDDGEARATWLAREDLLLPLVKGYCSEKAYEILGSHTLQTFGGSGYTQDYPIEQYVRDAKIDTLYEGTTAIQALDLLFRKIVRDEGRSLTWLTEQFERTASELPDDMAAEAAALRSSSSALMRHLGTMLKAAAESQEEGSQQRIHIAGLHATSFLFSLAELTVAWLLSRQAALALSRLQGETNDSDTAFYTGKLHSARWYTGNVLPSLASRAAAVEREEGSLMSMPDSAF